MAFPTVSTTRVELQLAGAWTDVTNKVRVADGIRMTRGRANEADQIDPSSCQLTFDNRDGRFSPRNPMGPYYGLIGRNTPIRVSTGFGPQRWTNPIGANPRANAPDSAGLSITGDIDLRWDGRMPDWSAVQTLVGKLTDPSQRSYALFLNGHCYPQMWWSADGSNWLTATATVPLPITTGRQALRATLDVDNGAAGRTVTFYTAPTLAGTWTQLGDPVVQAGVTSIFDSTAQVQVNSSTGAGAAIYGAEIRQGIGGTVRANPDFTAQTEGATSFTDAAGNTWTGQSSSLSTNRRYRFYGEVSTWPVTWGLDQADIRTPAVAAGITRRLGQGAAPLQSALRRGLGNLANLVAYWPMEDEDGATQFASAVSSGNPMTWTGTPDLAASSIIAGSAPLPTIENGSLIGYIAAAPDGTIETRAVFYIPPGSTITDGSVLFQLITTGTARYWNFAYFNANGGSIGVIAYDAAGTPITTWSAAATNVVGNRFNFSFNLTTSGANVNYAVFMENIDLPASTQQFGSFAGTVGHAQVVTITPGGTWGGTETVIGHVHVLSVITNGSDLTAYEKGQAGEAAGQRIARLSADQNLTLVSYGPLSPSSGPGPFQLLGPTPISTFLEALNEAADVDLGLLFEPRDTLGLAYRPRETLYNQTSQLDLDYGWLGQLDPVDDDQAVRNDVTVTRKGGSSVRRQLTTGALSNQAPPNGVGTYDTEFELNLYSDAYLQDQAGWRLRMGTIDEARYPVVSLNLASGAFVASSARTGAALDLDIGDLFTISNLPAWLPPDKVRLIAQGFTETITDTGLSIEVNCTPASAWDVGVYDDPGTRYSPDASTLTSSITSTATGAGALSITTPAGYPLWTTNPTDFPLDIRIAGERITLSAISGTSSPQSATVSARSVNGVVKAQTAGAAIDLADPTYYAL